MEDTTTTQADDIGQNSGPRPLPCLNSNISNETPQNLVTERERGGEPEKGKCPTGAPLSTQHRKTAFILKESVQQLAQTHGIEKLGFLTLTFAQHITCPKEAQRRLNCLITGVIKPRYRDYLGVFERQKSGRIHYHFLVVLSGDIRTGFDFEAVANHNYASANPLIRSEWTYWRITAKKYGFGRTELLPVRSTMEAMAKYVGKYIAKHTECRDPQDKGVRLVRYSRGARAGTTRFQFQSTGSQRWRLAVNIFAQRVQDQHPETPICQLSDLSRVLGKRWAYFHRDTILQIAENLQV